MDLGGAGSRPPPTRGRAKSLGSRFVPVPNPNPNQFVGGAGRASGGRGRRACREDAQTSEGRRRVLGTFVGKGGPGDDSKTDGLGRIGGPVALLLG